MKGLIFSCSCTNLFRKRSRFVRDRKDINNFSHMCLWHELVDSQTYGSVARQGWDEFLMHLSSEPTKGISGRFAYEEMYAADAALQNFNRGKFWRCKSVIKPLTLSCVWRDVGKFDGKYMRPDWECDESIHGKSYGNRRNNRVLPEISYYLAVLLRANVRGRKQPCWDERGDRNVTECLKRVSAAGYSAHEARTLQINQGSSGFRRGESMRAASRCGFLNGQKGQNDALVEKTDGKGGGHGVHLSIYRLKYLNNNSCLVREQFAFIVNTKSMRLNLSLKCFNLRWQSYKFVLHYFALAQTQSQRDALFARK